MTQNKYWIYLEELRRSGKTNMFGAARWIVAEFGVDNSEAEEILMDWMSNYDPKDYE